MTLWIDSSVAYTGLILAAVCWLGVLFARHTERKK